MIREKILIFAFSIHSVEVCTGISEGFCKVLYYSYILKHYIIQYLLFLSTHTMASKTTSSAVKCKNIVKVCGKKDVYHFTCYASPNIYINVIVIDHFLSIHHNFIVAVNNLVLCA